MKDESNFCYCGASVAMGDNPSRLCTVHLIENDEDKRIMELLMRYSKLDNAPELSSVPYSEE